MVLCEQQEGMHLNLCKQWALVPAIHTNEALHMHSRPPLAWPGSKQAAAQKWSLAWELGTPVLVDLWPESFELKHQYFNWDLAPIGSQ